MKIKFLKTPAALATFLYAFSLHAGTVTYVYTDSLGTPLAEANAAGEVISTFDYRPYGDLIGSQRDGVGYAGHVTDMDAGLVYMQARYYDPIVARFLGVDPKRQMEGDTFNFNRYVYVESNPILRRDPDGKDPATEKEAIAQAKMLNAKSDGSGSTGFYSVVRNGPGENDFSVQPTDIATMEKAGMPGIAEGTYGAGSAGQCRVTCAGISATSTALGISGDDKVSKRIDAAKSATDVAGKATKLIEKSPIATDGLKKIGNKIPYVNTALKGASAVNSYKMCMSQCTVDYQNRSQTQDNREQ